MAVSKVEKAANIVLKNPSITNTELAKIVKTSANAGWTLRRNAEKFIERHGMKKAPLEHKVEKPKAPVQAETPSTSGLQSDLQSLGGKIEVQGEYIQIRIPTKSLGSILLSKLLH